MADWVLDSSAILARFAGEAGAETVEAGAAAAVVSAVNYAEVVGKLVDRGLPAEAAMTAAGELRLVVVPFDEAAALRAGALRAETRGLGLSLGDRACLTLAEALGLPVLTADRAWAELDLDVEVVLIR
jgi:ribonuclease VapC